MALVQYDMDSSDSDTENEDSKITELQNSVDSQSTSRKRSLKVKKDSNQANKKIKIAIPKIDEYDKSEDDPSEISGPKFTSKTDVTETSGLLLKLPPPQKGPSKKITTTSFVPHSVNRKTAAPNKTKPLAKVKPKEVKEKSSERTDFSLLDDDIDSDDDLASMPTNFDEEMWSQVCGRRPKNVPSKNIEINPNPVILLTEENASKEKPAQLDNAAFKKLVGSSKRLLPTDITITDIAEADILEKTDVWMRKALTDPQYQQKTTPSEEDESANPVARNKHHITYLAQQAKAKEQELQAQWASGNQKRQMSRAKYGF